MRSNVVLLSGGLDSATALGLACQVDGETHVVHCSYGQETAQAEHQAVLELCEHYDVANVHTIDTTDLQGSALTDGEAIDGEIVETYVPFRNATLLSMATAYAEANNCSAIWTGIHESQYPDCAYEFLCAFQETIITGTAPGTSISLQTPFLDYSKTRIVDTGHDLDVPFGMTWSCYRNTPPACGECDACQERLEAFDALGLSDPVAYV